MPRPSFSVVAGTLVVLVGFGALRRYVAPFIPPRHAAVSPESADYLRAGESLSLGWRPLTAELVAVARATRRPILLFIGSESSRYARDLDERVLNDTQIVRFIADNFIPARLDVTFTPAWRGALSPVGRTGTYRDEGLQIMVLTPEGRPVAFLSPPALGLRFERDDLAAFLDGGRRLLADLPPRTPAEIAIAAETAILSGPRREIPPPDSALVLRSRIDPASGLEVVPGGARLSPWSLDAIARAGEPTFARDALRALAASAMNDPLEGGAFVWATDRAPGATRRVECTKGLLLNAALAETAARVAVTTGDPTVDRLARRTADWCLSALEGDAPAFLLTDQTPDGLSPFYSLTTRRVPSNWIRNDIRGLRARLGADRDPQALGRLTVAPDPPLAAELAQLAQNGPPRAEVNRRILAIEATAIARLLGTARLLGDEERVRLLGERLDALELSVDRTRADSTLLLALADAHFADFLANGRAQGLDLSAGDLETLLNRYGTEDGSLRAGDGLPGLRFAPSAPDLADGDREAGAAVAVRLADAIGRALESGPRARRFRDWSLACVRRYAPILGTDADHPNGVVSAQSAAFFGACASVANPTWRVAAGPDPVRAATEELRRYPYALILPAIGAAAPGVSRGESGIVIRRDPTNLP